MREAIANVEPRVTRYVVLRHGRPVAGVGPFASATEAALWIVAEGEPGDEWGAV